MDEYTDIKKHIERMVTQLAREHQLYDDTIWRYMMQTAAEHIG